MFRRAPAARLLWDEPDDVSHADGVVVPAVAHAFSVGGTGVRAAGAYAPGHKVAVGGELRADTHGFVKACLHRNVRTVFFHGFFPSLPALANAAHQSGLRVVAVWHGATTQLAFAEERDGLSAVVKLRERSVISAIAAAKVGWHLAVPSIDAEPWINFAPRAATGAAKTSPSGVGVLPAPVNWSKNFHANLSAAAHEPRLLELRATQALRDAMDADGLLVPDKLVFAPCASRAAFFAELARADVVLNASLSECQPMVALEAAVHGTLCLTPAIGLDEGHPFQRLCTVADPSNANVIAATLARALDAVHADVAGVAEMARGFVEQHQARARARFAVLAGLA